MPWQERAKRSPVATTVFSGHIFVLSLTPLDFKGPVTPKRAEEYARAVDRQVAMHNKKLVAAKEQRVEALFKHFGLEQGDWQSLALRLAAQHVPGFQISRTLAIRNLTDEDVLGFHIVGQTRGKTKEWDAGKLARLLQQYRDHVISHPHCYDRDALRALKKKDEWKGWKLETLESRLQDAKSQHRHIQRLCEEYIIRRRREDASV
jgi:hypothetical protein